MRTNILVAVPTYSGDVRFECAGSLVELAATFHAEGIAHRVQFIPGLVITAARNKAATMMLEGGFSHLLFVDADIGFNADIILSMVKAAKAILACAYLKRELPSGYLEGGQLSELLQSNGSYAVVPSSVTSNNDITQVKRVGMGLMLIGRIVFETLKGKCEIYNLDGQQIEFFRMGVFEGEFRTEDYDFCERWAQEGGEIFVMPQADIVHTGPIALQGCYAASLTGSVSDGSDAAR